MDGTVGEDLNLAARKPQSGRFGQGHCRGATLPTCGAAAEAAMTIMIMSILLIMTTMAGDDDGIDDASYDDGADYGNSHGDGDGKNNDGAW